MDSRKIYFVEKPGESRHSLGLLSGESHVTHSVFYLVTCHSLGLLPGHMSLTRSSTR